MYYTSQSQGRRRVSANPLNYPYSTFNSGSLTFPVVAVIRFLYLWKVLVAVYLISSDWVISNVLHSLPSFPLTLNFSNNDL